MMAVAMSVMTWVGVWGLGFGVWGSGFGVLGLGFGVWGLRCGVWGLEFGVWGLGFTTAPRHPKSYRIAAVDTESRDV